MRKILINLFLVLFTVSLFAFNISIDGTPQTLYNNGKVSDILISESTANEFTGVTKIEIEIQNAFLMNTVNNSYNAYSDSLYSSNYTVTGVTGTNIIEITFNDTNSETLETLNLINVFVVPYIESGDISYKITFFGANYEQYTIVVAKKEIKPVYYSAYFTNVGKWWTGIAITNGRDEDVTINIDYHFADEYKTISYIVKAKGLLIIPLYNIPEFDEQYGWFETELPEKVKILTILGDGIQSYNY